MSLEDKLTGIFEIINDIKNDDPAVSAILMESFGISLNIMQQSASLNGRENIDISSYLELITEVLGISLKDLVIHILENTQQQTAENNKAADEETLKFITGDLDDYEKFLAQNRAKEDLEFLSNSL